jgi:hypothetical protein
MALPEYALQSLHGSIIAWRWNKYHRKRDLTHTILFKAGGWRTQVLKLWVLSYYSHYFLPIMPQKELIYMMGKCTLSGYSPWVPTYVHQAALYLGANGIADLYWLRWPVDVQTMTSFDDPTHVVDKYLEVWWEFPLQSNMLPWAERSEDHLAIYCVQVQCFDFFFLLVIDLFHKPACDVGSLNPLPPQGLYFTVPHLSLRTPCVRRESARSPHGVCMESAQSPHDVHGLSQIVNKKNKNTVHADSPRTMTNERMEKVLFN